MSQPERERGFRVLIVDDEPLARETVRVALEKDPDVEVIGECGDGEEAVETVLQLKPDAVFLDIQMPGLDGFDVIEQVGLDEMPPVVFVTAYDRYSLRAFEVHALDYVLKPFEPGRVRRALRHVREQVSGRRGELRKNLAALLEEMAGGGVGRGNSRGGERGYAKRLMVRKDDRIRFVPVEDIDWIEAARDYVRLHVGDETHLISATMKGLQERLDPSSFVRIHRSTIVNLSRVKEVQPWFHGDYVVILRNGEQLRVSRSYRDDLLRPTW